MASGRKVRALEVLEDFSASARCDEGFLHIRRLRVHNRREDGTVSKVYRVDVVDRPKLDAVAVLVHRQVNGRVEVLTRTNLRPAAYFRKDREPTIPDDREYLHLDEIVAGVLENEDKGEAGLRHRAAEEVREEAGFAVSAEEIQLLGGAFFVAPGIVSEKIHLAAVEVTGRTQVPPSGDGSPMEEGATVTWWKIEELLAACRDGRVPDAKTEIAIVRFLEGRRT
jgi:ADP-ribose pyrophosphatase